jgi:CPA2 family monovalent cation:H+ antiporter-2
MPLISTIVVGLTLAFIFGAIANRIRLSPIVGFLIAGIVIGPFTPGFVGDTSLASQLAEIGVILLMFGVGLHFSWQDLLAVRSIAVPGAVTQIAIATLLGLALGSAFGWTLGAGLVFGLALSVASTVVLLRALEERNLLDSRRGQIAVGWLIVEDLAMVLLLVLIPAVSPLFGGEAEDGAAASTLPDLLFTVAVTLGKVLLFAVLMIVVGRRAIPWALARIAGTGSRELFTLCVLVIAMGVAYAAATVFGVSFALGAFFAGMILSESDLSQKAAEDSLPLRDAFAVLFFVSVGMLFDPMILVRYPLPVLATLVIIVFGKSVAAFLIVIAFRHTVATALTISASLAQIGEFSFILATLGLRLELLPKEGSDLILAGAILSIITNPLIFFLVDRYQIVISGSVDPAPGPDQENAASSDASGNRERSGHAVLVGFGRVGALVGEALRARGTPLVIVEDRRDRAQDLRERKYDVIAGNAVRSEVLADANIGEARWLVVAVPNAFEAGRIIAQAREANPQIVILARANQEAEIEHLTTSGADLVIMGEKEIARGMVQRISLEPAT